MKLGWGRVLVGTVWEGVVLVVMRLLLLLRWVVVVGGVGVVGGRGGLQGQRSLEQHLLLPEAASAGGCLVRRLLSRALVGRAWSQRGLGHVRV